MSGLQYLAALAERKGSARYELEPFRRYMELLGAPQDRVPAIQVAGTNGKGSVSAALAAIIGSSGARVGLYTSPHLASLNERIVIDGVPLLDTELESRARQIEELAQRHQIELSFFEAMTAIAFATFSQAGIDWMVIEVGLGGRLDATSVISAPRACVLVNVDLDHTEILGNSLAEIAHEKCAILRGGAVWICGDLHPQARVVAEAVELRSGAPGFSYGRDFSVHPTASGYCLASCALGEVPFSPALPGAHQGHNMGVAIATARALGFSAEACQRGVAQLHWPGRFERIAWGSREVILDAAHNPAGVRALCAALDERALFKVEIAFGVMANKSWLEMVRMLSPRASHWHLLQSRVARALECAPIACEIRNAGGACTEWGSDLPGFLRYAQTGETPLVICGSIYLMGELRRHLVSVEHPLWMRNSDSPAMKPDASPALACDS